MNNVFISCKESRIENNRSFYGCFNIGSFDPVQSLTVANALRRTLLSECPGLGIISVTIENVSHEYSTLPGMRESVLDLLLNLKEIVFRSNIDNIPSKFSEKLDYSSPRQSLPRSPIWGKGVRESGEQGVTEKKDLLTYNDFLSFFITKKRNPKKPLVGYLKVKGPGVIRARDLKLPPFIQCVDSNQYIATLAEDGYLSMKFILMEGKGYLIQKNNSFINNNLLKKRANLLNDIKKTQGYNNKLGIVHSERNNELESYLISPLNKKVRFQKEKESSFSLYPSPLRGGEGPNENILGKTNTPLNLDCIFNPVTKVSYIIEDFDNKVTNDFNNNLSFINDISSLLESSAYLKNHIISSARPSEAAPAKQPLTPFRQRRERGTGVLG
jgi:DNA-directed RNA polymerase alpha subunit